jgi:hypothetical protein
MPSSDCTNTSNDGSRPRLCYHRLTLQNCYSGLCSLPARSPCARSMAGRRSPRSRSISRLTSPLEQRASSRWRSRHTNSNHIPDGTSIHSNTCKAETQTGITVRPRGSSAGLAWLTSFEIGSAALLLARFCPKKPARRKPGGPL